MVIAVVNPISLGLLSLQPVGSLVEVKRVGKQGADSSAAKATLGVPLACGGPYFGFMATHMQ